MHKDLKFIEDNLLAILQELKSQTETSANSIPPTMMIYSEQVDQIEEFVLSAGEFGIAYENIISLIEITPVQLSGAAVIKLLEVALLFGFKTQRSSDAEFDRR